MKLLPLCCPCSEKHPLEKHKNGFRCLNQNCEHNEERMHFPLNGNTPILVSEEKTDTVCTRKIGRTYIERRTRKLDLIKKLLVGVSSVTKSNCEEFMKEVKKLSDQPKILVIGGAEKGSGTEALWNDDRCEVHSIDIYPSPTVDIICDAHYLPLQTHSYHGVWIQAVLQHVVEPKLVVSEIYRVLVSKGVVYAETPFMQQVHEGAYDFNRFTVLGHRYLFCNFSALRIGGNKGPEVVLAWSIRYFFWALIRSKTVARIIGIIFGLLLRPFNRIMSPKSMFDASSGVFFLGRKEENYKILHKDVVKLYSGQQ